MRLWCANEWHYYVIEKTARPWGQVLRRQYTMLTGRGRAWREAWARRHGPREEERMADVETPTIAPAALGRVFFSKLDTETAQALRAAITEELGVPLSSEPKRPLRSVHLRKLVAEICFCDQIGAETGLCGLQPAR